jgi:hypothetical protein
MRLNRFQIMLDLQRDCGLKRGFVIRKHRNLVFLRVLNKFTRVSQSRGGRVTQDARDGVNHNCGTAFSKREKVQGTILIPSLSNDDFVRDFNRAGVRHFARQ